MGDVDGGRTAGGEDEEEHDGSRSSQHNCLIVEDADVEEHLLDMEARLATVHGGGEVVSFKLRSWSSRAGGGRRERKREMVAAAARRKRGELGFGRGCTGRFYRGGKVEEQVAARWRPP